MFGMLLRGQAERKQAEELARKSSNKKGRNAKLGVCGNDCPADAPSCFPVILMLSQGIPALYTVDSFVR